MKREALLRMSETQIDGYARQIGLDVTGCETKEDKADAIEAARERVADICVLGEQVSVPIKRLHDTRANDKIAAVKTSRQARAALRDILGKEQAARVEAAATDEDGTVDEDALVFAFASVIRDPALKNFSS